jgi:hypothetical protein
MIAYTAWDSLQAIAREYNADLSLDAGTRLALVPHWQRLVRSAPVRGLNEWSRRRLTALQPSSGSRA